MPMYKEWQHGKHTRAAIWKIEEPEIFFTGKTGLQSDKKIAMRRLEHLAGRFLLQQLQPDIDLVAIAVSPLGKPFLPGNPLFFSISHSFPFIAAAVDDEKEIGIDVQVLQDKILRLQYKFLSGQEQLLCGNDPGKVTLAWAAKEAAFKRYGLGAVDFIRHMPITALSPGPEETRIKMAFSREEPLIELALCGGIEEGFAWSVTV